MLCVGSGKKRGWRDGGYTQREGVALDHARQIVFLRLPSLAMMQKKFNKIYSRVTYN